VFWRGTQGTSRVRSTQLMTQSTGRTTQTSRPRSRSTYWRLHRTSRTTSGVACRARRRRRSGGGVGDTNPASAMCVEMARALADGPRRRAGRPRQLDLRVADRICREFRYGLGYRAIATRLDLDGVATAHGAPLVSGHRPRRGAEPRRAALTAGATFTACSRLESERGRAGG
jgi:hypothetical protein